MNITFSTQQWSRISEILGNLSLVFFSSIVLPILFGLETRELRTLIAGLLLFVSCIIGSIAAQKKGVIL